MAGTYYPAYLRYATLAISSCTSSTTTGRATCSAVEPNNLASLVVQTCMQKREKSLRPTCQSAMRGTHVSQARRTTRYRRRQAMGLVRVCLSVWLVGAHVRAPLGGARAPYQWQAVCAHCPSGRNGAGSRAPAGWMAIRAIKMPRRSVCLSLTLSLPAAGHYFAGQVVLRPFRSPPFLSFPASSFWRAGDPPGPRAPPSLPPMSSRLRRPDRRTSTTTCHIGGTGVRDERRARIRCSSPRCASNISILLLDNE